MRIQGKLRLGFFPLSLTEARRIRACLRYPASPCSAIDPCIGDGAAFLTITGESCARRYGIELDAYRAEQAAAVVDEMIHGDCLDVHCSVESCGLAFLNPPLYGAAMPNGTVWHFLHFAPQSDALRSPRIDRRAWTDVAVCPRTSWKKRSTEDWTSRRPFGAAAIGSAGSATMTSIGISMAAARR
jgi:hypothetical protein